MVESSGGPSIALMTPWLISSCVSHREPAGSITNPSKTRW